MRCRPARHGHIRRGDDAVLENQDGLVEPEKRRRLHPVKVVVYEREQMNLIGEVLRIAQKPKIRLVGAVTALPEVDRLDSRVTRRELLAVRLRVVDAVAERERVARADNADPSRRDRWLDVVRRAKPLAVGMNADAFLPEVGNRHVPLRNPAEIGIVFGIRRRLPRQYGDVAEKQKETDGAFEDDDKAEQDSDVDCRDLQPSRHILTLLRAAVFFRGAY